VLVADAGYWHQQQMERIVDRGIAVLIPPDAKSRKGTRPGWDGGLYAFMRRVLATERGGELYGQRQAIIEPVFANTKFNRGIDPLPATRPSRRSHRVATDHRDAQPPQAPPARPQHRLRAAAAAAAAPAENSPPKPFSAAALCTDLRDSVPGRQRPPLSDENPTWVSAALPRALRCPRRGLTPRRPATDVEPLCTHFPTSRG
jgi:hypothetical protein